MPRNTGIHHVLFDGGEDYFYQDAASRFNEIIDAVGSLAPGIDDEVVGDRQIADLFGRLVADRIDEQGLRPTTTVPRNASQRQWFDQHVFRAYRRGRDDAQTLLGAADVGRPRTPPIGESVRHQAALDRVFSRQRRYWRSLADDVEADVRDEVLGVLRDERGTMGAAKRAATDRLEHVGKYRSRLIAETETGRAYNEAMLAEYEEAGVDVVEVDWITAGDTKVCEACLSMAGAYSVEEARAMLREGTFPHHTRCRCVLVPSTDR